MNTEQNDPFVQEIEIATVNGTDELNEMYEDLIHAILGSAYSINEYEAIENEHEYFDTLHYGFWSKWNSIQYFIESLIETIADENVQEKALDAVGTLNCLSMAYCNGSIFAITKEQKESIEFLYTLFKDNPRFFFFQDFVELFIRQAMQRHAQHDELVDKHLQFWYKDKQLNIDNILELIEQEINTLNIVEWHALGNHTLDKNILKDISTDHLKYILQQNPDTLEFMEKHYLTLQSLNDIKTTKDDAVGVLAITNEEDESEYNYAFFIHNQNKLIDEVTINGPEKKRTHIKEIIDRDIINDAGSIRALVRVAGTRGIQLLEDSTIINRIYDYDFRLKSLLLSGKLGFGMFKEKSEKTFKALTDFEFIYKTFRSQRGDILSISNARKSNAGNNNGRFYVEDQYKNQYLITKEQLIPER